MKRFVFILLLCLILCACSENAPSPSDTPVVVPEVLSDGKTKSEHIQKEDERIRITSLEVFDEFNFDGNFSDNCLLFLRGFIEGYSKFEEFETLKISDWEIIRDTKVYGYKMAFNFTVSESVIDTLPVGEYKTVITDSVDCYIDFVEAPRDKVDVTVPQSEAQSAVYDWLDFAEYYDFAPYGEWDSPLFAHYIRLHYGDKGIIRFSDFAKLALDKFGAVVTKEEFASGLYVEDMTLYIDTASSEEEQSFDFVDEQTVNGITTVTVQHYADCNKLIKSHKIAYMLDEEERFLSCEFLSIEPYKPYGLISVK